MMTENRTYSDYSKSILMGDHEPILKSILRQFFKGIYDEIAVKYEISSKNSEHIIKKGQLLNGKIPMDANNYYVHAGDMRNINTFRSFL